MFQVILAIVCTAFSTFAWGDAPKDWLLWRPGQPLNVVTPELPPFWKKKAKIYQKVLDERFVAVLVTNTEGESSHSTLRMEGAGHANVPARFAFDHLCKFDRLPKVSSYIRHATFHKDLGQLVIHSEAFGYKAFMRMQVEPVWEQGVGQLRVRIVEGVLNGLTALISLDPLPKERAEIALTAQYQYDKLPLPKLFIEFGFEVILQKVAERLRADAEQQWRIEQNVDKKSDNKRSQII